MFTGGGGPRREARMVCSGVDLRSTFFDTGEEEAGGEWLPGFDGATFVLREDFMVACFFVPEEGSIIVSHADFAWGFVVDVVVAFWWPESLAAQLLEEGLIILMLSQRFG